ncbi:MAG: sugar phosphate isomerase/epimerase [Kiritimatiellaeota bacterium]|nr:sugar phosphate isomerase/epimerase [Kiritimatiellota bacterium]
MRNKLGLHMCGWGDRPLPEVLVAARELGYDGVELAPAWLEKLYGGLDEIDRFLAREAAPLAPVVFVGGPRIDDKGLAVSVAQTGRYARWVKKHGGHGVIYSTVQGRAGLRTRQERERLRRAWDAVARAATAEGCTPLYHNHYVVSHEVSRVLLDEDMELLDWSTWQLCVDTGHLLLALHDPVSFIEEWSDKVAWMHCKDVGTSPFEEQPSGHRSMGDIAACFTSLGSGAVDFGGVVAVLDRVGYRGWFVVEQDSSPDPRATSEASLRHMRGVLQGGAAGAP